MDDPLTPILVKTAVHEDQVATLLERPHEFPGVSVVGTYLRDYENRALAAQVLGYVGEISPEELERLEHGRLPRRREDRQDRRRGGVRHAISAARRARRSSASTRSAGRRATVQPSAGRRSRATTSA